MCIVKPEDRPRIVTPVVAIVIEKPSQLADSLADHPIRMEFEVNQVSFTCELATALHVYWHIKCTVCHLGCTHSVCVYTRTCVGNDS